MREEKGIREAVILGALLHDIGKFVQRAQRNPSAHRHTYWGEDWFSKNLAEKINPVFGGKLTQKIASGINCHHDQERFITSADYISSKERDIDEDNPEIDPFHRRMISIFSKIFHPEGNYKYYKPNELSIKKFECLFPVDDEKSDYQEYEKLLNNFNNELRDCDFSKSSPPQVIETLYYFLQKYTWCIPSAAYKNEPDISLFEHLKTTAAIATCLYDLAEKDEKIFILLEGDISGIQEFIYSLTTEKALKGLRGRSFFIELLSEVIARKILDEFNLSICNLLFLAGGNFTILIPGVDDAESRINKILKETDEIIFNAFRGKLAVNFSYVKFRDDGFIPEKYEKVIESLKRELACEKKKKFKELLNAEFFQADGGRAEEKSCEICGSEFSGEEDRCKLCASFEVLSLKIRDAKLIEVEKLSSKYTFEKYESWEQVLKKLGYDYRFLLKRERTLSKDSFFYLINDTAFIENRCHGFRFNAIYSPVVPDPQTTSKTSIKTLEEIADSVVKGVKKWGVLRMDVDNLGKILGEELKEKTISRYNMFSNMLSLFFSMGIKVLVDGSYPNCCVVYSGGDDLFIIGPWIELPKIAQQIRERFSAYVGDKKNITLSGGIFIAPSKKFPVYHSATISGEALNNAKKNEKDKLSFLGEVLSWDDFKEVEETTDKIVKVLEKGVARSLLTILYAGYSEKKNYENEKGSIPFFRIWRLFYAIKRLMERHKECYGEIDELFRKRLLQEFDLSKNLNLAIRWAELRTRKI